MEATTVVSPQRLSVPKSLSALFALFVVVGTLAAGYQTTSTPVTLVVDGQTRRLRTHQDTVGALLTDVGLVLRPEDVVAPPPGVALRPGLTIRVDRAHTVHVVVDGRELTLRTHATSADEVLAEVGVRLNAHDVLEIKGEFPTGNPTAASEPGSEPVRVIVHRAIPLTLHEDDRATTFYTTAPTVGEALRQAGLTLYLADRVQPALGEPASAGMHVYVERSMPVTVEMDGRVVRTRTHRERVGDVLADLGVVLTGQDYTTPTLNVNLTENANVRVVRVSERFLTQQEPIPFESVWQPDPDLEIDHQRLLQEGSPGVRERRIRVRYENGHEVSRTLEAEYVAAPPATKIRGYGTKIVVRTLDTPSGPVEYWRKVHMLATSYSASTSGVSRSSPGYGRTATGVRLTKGIVAVDPRIVSLGSRVYVPGYGVGRAEDTGGAVKGKRIDLGYDDHNLELWYRWVDVYFLTPVPPASQIDYTLP